MLFEYQLVYFIAENAIYQAYFDSYDLLKYRCVATGSSASLCKGLRGYSSIISISIMRRISIHKIICNLSRMNSTTVVV